MQFDTIWELLVWRSRETPDALAAVDADGRMLTFVGLLEEAEEVASGLAALGVGGGSRVSWQLPTRIETLILMAALTRLGAAQNLIIPISREREVGFIAEQWGPQLLVVPAHYRGFDHAAMADRIQKAHPLLQVLSVPDRLPRGDRADLMPFSSGSEASPVRWILYSSGTTSAPKGACHTDHSVYTMAANLVLRLRIVPEDRTAVVAPLAHIGGIMWFVASLISGCASVVADRFDQRTLQLLKAQGVTLAGMGTTFHEAYLRHQMETDEPFLPHVRAFPGGGTTRAADLHRRLMATFGAGVVSGYGSTETGPLTLPDVLDPDQVLEDTEGRPFPGTNLKIIRSDGSDAALGEAGEICARGPQMMVGYVDASMDIAIDTNGYFHTGDLGSLDVAGNLTVRGRLKDIIIRKGENISAREVEELLLEHPTIADAAVIGLPDPVTGERCCAVLVMEKGQPTLNLDAVSAHLVRSGLPIQKVPEQIELVEELPRAGVGKIAKNALRERFATVAG